MMKKYRTRILSILLAVCLTVSVTVPAFAAESNTDVRSPLSSDAVIDSIIYPDAFGNDEASLLDQFCEMSISELNAYIDNIVATYPQSANAAYPASAATADPVFRAWLAASVVLLISALPCAFTLALHSLANEPYSETNGLFSEKIKRSSAYNVWLSDQKGFTIFKMTDVPDLHFALNKVDIALAPYSESTVVFVTGLFNFDEWEDLAQVQSLRELLSDSLNNIGWLLENTHVFHPISVTIGFAV